MCCGLERERKISVSSTVFVSIHREIITCAHQKYSSSKLHPELFCCSLILTTTWRSQVLAQALSLLWMRIILTTVNGCGQQYLSKTTVRKSTKDLAEQVPREIQNQAFFYFFFWPFILVFLSPSVLSVPICQKIHAEFQLMNE